MDQEIQVTEDMYAPRSDYYVATFGDFDLDCLTGRGHTPLDAIVDLLDQLEPVEIGSVSPLDVD